MNRRPHTRAQTSVLIMAIFLGGCQPGLEDSESTRVDVARGKTLFERNCVACHGSEARDGAAGSFRPDSAAPDLTRISARNGGSFSADDVMTTIDGYYRRDHPQDPMPFFGDQDMGPLVPVEINGLSTPIPASLLALSNYLESIQE